MEATTETHRQLELRRLTEVAAAAELRDVSTELLDVEVSGIVDAAGTLHSDPDCDQAAEGAADPVESVALRAVPAATVCGCVRFDDGSLLLPIQRVDAVESAAVVDELLDTLDSDDANWDVFGQVLDAFHGTDETPDPRTGSALVRRRGDLVYEPASLADPLRDRFDSIVERRRPHWNHDSTDTFWASRTSSSTDVGSHRTIVVTEAAQGRWTSSLARIAEAQFAAQRAPSGLVMVLRCPAAVPAALADDGVRVVEVAIDGDEAMRVLAGVLRAEMSDEQIRNEAELAQFSCGW